MAEATVPERTLGCKHRIATMLVFDFLHHLVIINSVGVVRNPGKHMEVSRKTTALVQRLQIVQVRR